MHHQRIETETKHKLNLVPGNLLHKAKHNRPPHPRCEISSRRVHDDEHKFRFTFIKPKSFPKLFYYNYLYTFNAVVHH